MPRTRIKFCGITRPEDATAAAHAGADAIGLVFHPSAARCVSVDRARLIVAALPLFVTPVGLFVDAVAAEVREVVAAVGLRAVQLHGDEPVETVAALAGLSVVKAVRADAAGLAAAIRPWRSVPLAGLLLETAGAPAVGGTGIANDWAGLAEAARSGVLDGLPPLIAAGGLTPGSVGGVIRAWRPWAVDVSTGIEPPGGVKGIKSPDLMATFAAAVRAADAAR